jgi:hypothetical protein
MVAAATGRIARSMIVALDFALGILKCKNKRSRHISILATTALTFLFFL